MSKMRFTFASLAITALCGLSAAQAQQEIPAKPGSVQQPNQPGLQPVRSQTDQADRYEARRVPSDQQAPTVQEAIVQKLKKANEAEIELAKLAIEQSDNQEVKQLAQMLVNDHQECVQKLQQWTGKSQQQGSRSNAGTTAATVPHELCVIAEKACANSLSMTKEMLGKYEGQDFNMAFLGQQCVAHMMMLAELKAIESDGPKELNQLAQESRGKVEQHLEKCHQLAKKLENDIKSNS